MDGPHLTLLPTNRTARPLGHMSFGGSEALAAAEDCALCAKLRKRGKFLKKCTHKYVPSPLYTVTEKYYASDGRLWRGKRAKHAQRIRKYSAREGGVVEHSSGVSLESVFASAEDGDVETLRRSLLNGFDLHARDVHGQTCLHFAADAGRLGAVEFLCAEAGVDVNLRDDSGLSSLDLALRKGHEQIANLLIKFGAVDTGHGGVSSIWGSRLWNLAALGKLDELRAIKDKGGSLSSTDIDRRTALHAAAEHGKIEVVRFLVEEGGLDVNQIDKWNVTPLAAAEARGFREVSSYLRCHGAKIVEPAQSSPTLYRLLEAAHQGLLSQVVELVEKYDCDVNGADYDDRTALHLAACSGSIEIVKYLLEKRADPLVTDRFGSTPYQDAIRNKHLEVAFLIDSQGSFSFQKAVALDVDVLEDIDDMDLEDEKGTVESDHSHTKPFASVRCCKRFGTFREKLHNLFQFVLASLIKDSPVISYAELWVADKQSFVMRCCREVVVGSPSFLDYHRISCSLPVERSVFFSGQLFMNRNIILYEDLDKVMQSSFPTVTAARDMGFKSCCVVPIFAPINDDVLGCAVFYSISVLDSQSLKCHPIQAAADIIVLDALCDKEKISRFDYAKCMRCLTSDQVSALEEDSGDSSSLRFSALTTPRTSLEVTQFVSYLIHASSFSRIFGWACSMNSEDHKAALPILLTLCTLGKIVPDDLWQKIYPEYELSLKFLVTVSPLERKNSPVREELLLVIEELKRSGLWRSHPNEPPYFGHGLAESPVLRALHQLKESLPGIWKDFVKKDEMLRMRSPVDLNEVQFSAMQVFQTFGAARDTGRSLGFGSRKGDDEHERVSKLCTDLLRQSSEKPLVTIENIIRVHECLELEGGRSKGEFRSTLAVGSFMFYKFYRVFAPAEEVESAMKSFEQDLATSTMNGILKSFYIYAAIVMFIHPFEDGNGRIGRLFANLVLVKEGYPPILQYKHKVISLPEVLEMMWEKLNRKLF